MIKYTGYMNAAGLFANRSLLPTRSDDYSRDYSSNSEDGDTELTILGQLLIQSERQHNELMNAITSLSRAPNQRDSLSNQLDPDTHKTINAQKIIHFGTLFSISRTQSLIILCDLSKANFAWFWLLDFIQWCCFFVWNYIDLYLLWFM